MTSSTTSPCGECLCKEAKGIATRPCLRRSSTTRKSSLPYLLCVATILMEVSQAFILPSHAAGGRSGIQRRELEREEGGVLQGRRMQTRLKVSERQIPQYKKTMLHYMHNGSKPIIPESYTTEDFISLLGDDTLIAKPGEPPYKLVHHSKFPLFSPEECQAVVDECEARAAAKGWTTRRHFAYPTTDVPLMELPQTRAWFNEQLQRKIYPMLATNFKSVLPNAKNLRVVDAFVVKYDADGGQTQLKPHRDGSVVSFNIALNPSDEYEGGGTYFKGLNDAIKMEMGHVVSHASNLLHGGHPITSGKRYILVAFVICEGYANWAMRWANQVWEY